MDNLGVIDQFLNVFSQYIDTGFGLLRGEVGFLTATLVAIDITLAGLFWAWAENEEVMVKLIKKVLYVGTFAFILNNFSQLASILFRSFSGLGLKASGTALTAAQLLRPGTLAAVGVDAGRPILTRISELSGFPDTLLNIDQIVVLLLAYLMVIVSFFLLSVQLFVTLIEFKLTTLAGFVLVPFALWNKTAFLAERVLGNVVSSGIKILVLAVIVGIGTQVFGQLSAPPGVDFTIDHALAVMLGSLALFGLGLFGPGIATGLISGGPQLGIGAAAGTALVAGGLAVAGTAATAGAVRLGASSFSSGVRGFRGASGAGGPGPSGNSTPPSAGGTAAGASAPPTTPGPATPAGDVKAEPDWARSLKNRGMAEGLSAATHATRAADRGGAGAHPTLPKDE
jgi:type IV secretion system protein TrbL